MLQRGAEVQPFHATNPSRHPLWVLHQLWNWDKHRVLHTASNTLVDDRLSQFQHLLRTHAVLTASDPPKHIRTTTYAMAEKIFRPSRSDPWRRNAVIGGNFAEPGNYEFTFAEAAKELGTRAIDTDLLDFYFYPMCFCIDTPSS